MYAIDRLTAPKPNWEYAIIYAKGVQPFAVSPDGLNIRRVDGVLIFTEKAVPHPFEQSTTEYDMVADKEVHFYEDEVVRIEFYNNAKRVKIHAQGPAQNTPTILTAEGEHPAIAAEREKLLEKKENPLKKVED